MSRRAVGVIIAVVGIVVAVMGVYSIRQILTISFAPPPVPTPQEQATELVVVAERDYAVGDVIDERGIALLDIPVGVIPRNAVRDADEVIGRIAKVPLVSGEMVLEHHLANPDLISHDIGFTMSENMVLMAFPASDLISTLNVLQRGDLVDIYVTLDQEVEIVAGGVDGVPVFTAPGQTPADDEEGPEVVRRTFTFDAMQATDISAIIADVQFNEEDAAAYEAVQLGAEEELLASTEPYPSSVRVQAYLLILNPQDALLLKHLVDIGGVFDMVLRAPNADQLFNLQPIMAEYLIDRYQLEIPR